MTQQKIRVEVSGKDAHTAYVRLPSHRTEPGAVARTLSLDEILAEYKGPRVYLDFNKEGELIGIEILVSM